MFVIPVLLVRVSADQVEFKNFKLVFRLCVVLGKKTEKIIESVVEYPDCASFR